jgi:Tfp pilus assembly protein PilP
MKLTLTTGILALGMTAGIAWGQNPDVIENTRNTLKAVEQKKAIDSNAALEASQGQSAKRPASTGNRSAAMAQAKPAASKPSMSHPVPAATAKPSSAKPATQPKSATPRATTAPKVTAAPKATKTAASKPAKPKPAVAVEDKNNPAEEKKEDKIQLTGRRDPFVSPVVNRSMVGSGCSTGKRCLAIDQISLKGVVKAEVGMIAVVVNAMNKAYFLRENDPVFNGYVVKITGDSIIFKETLQDKLGKSFTREVTKKITTPAV